MLIFFSARKKTKKKGPIKKLVQAGKLIFLLAALAVKICILIKMFNAAVQFKFMLIALAALVHQVIKSWTNYKHAGHQQKIVHLDHHDHHYDEDLDIQPSYDHWKI